MLYDAALSQDFANMLLREGSLRSRFFLSSCPKGPSKNSNTNFSSSYQKTLDKAVNAFVKVGKELKVI